MDKSCSKFSPIEESRRLYFIGEFEVSIRELLVFIGENWQFTRVLTIGLVARVLKIFQHTLGFNQPIGEHIKTTLRVN